MKNYLLIHRASNLIVDYFEAGKPDQPSDQYKLVPISDLVLDKYYAALARHKDGTCVDAGEFALVSPSFLDALKDA
ncbi:hypothetical protein TZ03_24220 [Pseudomonas sp. 10-1B]|uniref:hypothetical protein n=1 Tax=Pseudomonas sp. 10-1B TaxID=1546029 RepID=UPI00061E2D03|nr:hypothetical protein [Pseudomonas sp. 10-1B]KIY38157.1 hypothetical protein TZ03_24220 [Pseudomonas sp. 10-1B]